MSWMRNTWYVGATSDEVGDKPLGRRLLGARMAFFRDADGRVQAVEDFCPHRGAALSLGRVCKGELVCGYHGLVMGGDGVTRSMPGQRVSAFPRIQRFAVEERYGFIWVWAGEAEQADPSTIPVLEWHDNPAWAYGGGLFHIKADYRLMIDNLMDLTHETYVHSTSIGQEEIDETPCKTTREGTTVVTSRFMENIDAPPFWLDALRAIGVEGNPKVDRWQICRFSPPSHVLIEVGVALAGHGGYDAPDDKKVYSVVTDFITPEVDGSMWYFWGMARRFKPDDAELTERIRAGQDGIFTEDLEVLERQQQNLDAFAQRKLLKLNIDAGGVQARRLIDEHIARETAVAA